MDKFIEINGKHFINKLQRQLYYKVFQNEDDSTILHFGSPKFPCGIILISENIAVIINLSYSLKCTNPLLDKGVGMYEIMRAMIQKIIELRVSRQLTFTTIEFTDNSTIIVDKYELYLADAHRLITGNTWYQDILPELHIVPKNKMKQKELYDDKLKLDKLITSEINYDDVFPENEIVEQIWKSFATRNIKDTCKEIRNKEPIFWVKHYVKLMNHLDLSRLNGIDFISTSLPDKLTSYFRS